MEIIKLIGSFFQVVFFFMNLWTEKNKEKAEDKKQVALKIVDAFSQTDKDLRASRLNSAVAAIKRVR